MGGARGAHAFTGVSRRFAGRRRAARARRTLIGNRASQRPVQRTFRGVVEDGHKGKAIIVPFDPEQEFGVAPRAMPYFGGKLQGFPVSVRVDGARLDTWIGRRWGRHFILAEGPLAGLRAGDDVAVTVTMKAGSSRARRR